MGKLFGGLCLQSFSWHGMLRFAMVVIGAVFNHRLNFLARCMSLELVVLVDLELRVPVLCCYVFGGLSKHVNAWQWLGFRMEIERLVTTECSILLLELCYTFSQR